MDGFYREMSFKGLGAEFELKGKPFNYYLFLFLF